MGGFRMGGFRMKLLTREDSVQAQIFSIDLKVTCCKNIVEIRAMYFRVI